MPYFPRPANGSRFSVWKTMLHIKKINFTWGSHSTTLKCPRPGQTREENSVLKLCQLVTICSPMYCWYQVPYILSNWSDWVDSPGTTSETKMLPHVVLCIVYSKWCSFPPTGHTEWTTLQPHHTQNCYHLQTVCNLQSIPSGVHPYQMVTLNRRPCSHIRWQIVIICICANSCDQVVYIPMNRSQ